MRITEFEDEPSKQTTAERWTETVPILELTELTISASRTVRAPNCELRNIEKVSSKKLISTQSSAEKKMLQTRTIGSEFDEKLNCEDTEKKLHGSVPAEDTSDREKSWRRCSCWKYIFFLLLYTSVAILAIFFHENNVTSFGDSEVRWTLDFTNASVELRQRIFGQDNAVRDLIGQFERARFGLNVIGIVGGTGVGKSYAVGIVGKYFPHKNHIFEYSPPFDKTLDRVFESFSNRHCNLLILENLKTQDLEDVVNFVKFIKDKADEFCVFALAIFNPRQVDHHLQPHFDLEKSLKEITSAFREGGIDDAKMIGFETLDGPSLDSCIRRAAREKNVDLSDGQLSEIRQILIISKSGCKGAYAKVQLFINS